jgi:hypothetical protein
MPHPEHASYGASEDGTVYHLRTMRSIGYIDQQSMRWRLQLQRKDSRPKEYLRARFVWETLHQRLLADGCDCDHIDGNPTNDAVANLQELTRQLHAKKTVAQNAVGRARGARTRSKRVRGVSEDGLVCMYESIAEMAAKAFGGTVSPAAITVAIQRQRPLRGWTITPEVDTPPALDETWQAVAVPGVIGVDVSSYGRVRWHRNSRITYGTSLNGYQVVCLLVGGVQRTCYVHQLVTTTFLGPRPSQLHTVNHKNRNRTGNRVANLEWATPREQAVHAHGKAVAVYDTSTHATTLYLTVQDAAVAMGVSGPAVSYALRHSGTIAKRYNVRVHART